MSKKELIVRFLYKAGLIRLIMLMNRLLGNRLLILAYHRVYDTSSAREDNFESDIELISASTSQFEWQVQYLKRHYKVVTFKEYIEIVGTGKTIKDLVIITFDDGFKDNYQNAYPILKKHGIPAVFYVATGYTGTEKPFWFEFLVSVVNQVPSAHLKELGQFFSLGNNGLDRKMFAEAALEHLKRVPDEIRQSTISAISHYCDEHSIAIDSSKSTAMNWDELLEMSQNGMEIGSHTMTHPILTNLSTEAINSEIIDSKEMIEQKLYAPCQSFSYPNGGPEDINQTVTDAVFNGGYQYACSYISGANYHSNLSRFTLKRLHVERYVGREYFASMLAIPWLFN